MAVQKSDASSSSLLKGNVGPIGIALMVVATAAPLTTMAGISPLVIGLGNGIAAPMDAIAVAIIMLLFSVGFVSMSRYVNNAGAFYTYIQKGLGRICGLGAASLAVVSYTLIVIALEAYIGTVISSTLANFAGVSLPWWAGTLAIVALVGFLGYRNIEVSTKVLGIALVLEVVVILALNFSVLRSAGAGGISLAPFSMSSFLSGSPGLGILFAVFGFIGFESTVVYREEAADPERSIPLATYIAVIFIGALYSLSFWCVVIAVGPENVVRVATETPDKMYLDLVSTYLGRVAHDAGEILLITSLFAVVLSIHNVIARYKYVLSRCGVLIAPLGKVHERHASPHVASSVQTIVSAVTLGTAAFLGSDPIKEIYTRGAGAGTLGYMIIVALACMAVIAFFMRQAEKNYWKTIVAPTAAFAGLASFLYIAFSNLSALTGSEGMDPVNLAIIALLVVSFLVGVVWGAYMRFRAPHRFAAILHHV